MDQKENSMFFINIPKIKGKIAEKGYSMTSFANAIGISRNTLYCYMMEPDRIPYFVMCNMAEILCDRRNEAAKIVMYDPKWDE